MTNPPREIHVNDVVEFMREDGLPSFGIVAEVFAGVVRVSDMPGGTVRCSPEDLNVIGHFVACRRGEVG